MTHKLEHSDITIPTHLPHVCKGETCTIHNMSDHHMRSFPQNWRYDRGFMERICTHGIGHPDPDEIFLYDKSATRTVHGCDGCCAKGE